MTVPVETRAAKQLPAGQTAARPWLPLPAWLADVLALGAGAALPLAFAPWGFYPLALISPVLLFASWLGVAPRRAFWRGWLFGAGMFGVGVHWVYHSMHVFAHMAAPLAIAFTGIFVGFLALFPALTGWLATRWFAVGFAARLVWVFPTLWVLSEWVRSWFLTGFPWLNIGYTQIGTPLAGLAPLTGVYGLSWLVALSAGLVLALLVGRGLRVRAGYVLLLLAVWLAGWGADHWRWTSAVGRPLKVSLVQGNISQDDKWRLSWRLATLERYLELTRPHWDSDLIVWPETAIPDFYQDVKDSFLPILQDEARKHHADMLVGLVLEGDQPEQYYNSMMSIGREQGFYRKRHLVPFGEYIPLQSVMANVLDILHIPMSSFSAGRADQPLLHVAGYPIGMAICYEIAFGEEVITALPQAAFLVNVSNNAWFGDSAAPHQQLQMAQMRARETGRYVLSDTNNGVTAIVDDRGRIVAIAPQFEATVLSGSLQPRQGATPYVRYGNYPVVLAAFGMLGLQLLRRPRRGWAAKR